MSREGQNKSKDEKDGKAEACNKICHDASCMTGSLDHSAFLVCVIEMRWDCQEL